MWLMAQAAGDLGPKHSADGYGGLWSHYLLSGGLELLGTAYLIFWLWMLIHCLRTEPDRSFWIWLLIVAQGVGPVLYFLLRYMPSTDVRAPAFLRRWTRGRELSRLETATVQIGNPHQFVQWADALRSVGQLDRATAAYQHALLKEPQNLPALWGATQVAMQQNRFADARTLSRQILDKDPQYKFGDVSLAHGRTLIELREPAAALEHLDAHVRRWRHPEAVFLLAKLHADRGDAVNARDHLQALLHDINGSPAAIARKHGRWKSRARQLLRKLPST
jgi:hypothetical protein